MKRRIDITERENESDCESMRVGEYDSSDTEHEMMKRGRMPNIVTGEIQDNE